MDVPRNGSYTASLDPTRTERSSSDFLSSSLSSLASSPSARRSSSHVLKTYRQSSTLFLTRRLPEALSTILPLIKPTASYSEGAGGIPEPAPVANAPRNTRVKVWTLYIAIVNAIAALEPNEGKDAFGTQEWRSLCAKVQDGDIWEEVVQDGYHGVEGDVEPDVVINLATLLLTHAKTQTLNQKRLETYFATSKTPTSEFSKPLSPLRSRSASSRHRSTSRIRSGADTPRDLNARVKILELYILHVLVRNGEWDYAREFISLSSILDEERREAFLQALQSLQEDRQENERKELEEKQLQEEQLRHDLERARRLRAGNEEREKRRLEEERARREGSEIDDGVDTRSTGEPPTSKARRVRSLKGGAHQSSRSIGSTVAGDTSHRQSKAVASASFGARAALLFANVRTLIERMSTTLHTDPMLLLRRLVFLASLIVMLGNRNIRTRMARILRTSWIKMKATAGMGVKVSYI